MLKETEIHEPDD